MFRRLFLHPHRRLAFPRPPTATAAANARFLTTSLPTICPACSAPLPTPLPACPKCAHISPLPDDTSYYTLFRLPSPSPDNPAFNLDTKILKQYFLNAQRICHPDNWSVKGDKAQSIAASQSSMLNKAYTTLLSPLKRAEYLLSLQGITMAETDKLDHQDQEFILEILDAREELEEATTEAEVEDIRARNQERIDATIRALQDAFEKRDWVRAKSECVRLRYWNGIESASKGEVDH
ncbi:hypothetical protein BOTBODRAFT_47515 [Botryobasidium botryosum FD-172 SS1]|uniref:Co-chaperone HscB C-terminal oligomerisation domain-containing protein n=1 Tax=Botryobasidium botryosum (strain FD-172 SS1) TaxID=930990 RepID=A0A067MDJ3_BOTB1|nr:hypothetical protein BOTBODRAFT_47515 [Botryobasidium botryosum FD-172 SS1]